MGLVRLGSAATTDQKPQARRWNGVEEQHTMSAASGEPRKVPWLNVAMSNGVGVMGEGDTGQPVKWQSNINL